MNLQEQNRMRDQMRDLRLAMDRLYAQFSEVVGRVDTLEALMLEIKRANSKPRKFDGGISARRV